MLKRRLFLRVSHFEAENSEDGEAISLTTYPGLNCLEQDDPRLIQALREDILHPPSETGDGITTNNGQP